MSLHAAKLHVEDAKDDRGDKLHNRDCAARQPLAYRRTEDIERAIVAEARENIHWVYAVMYLLGWDGY